MSMSPEWQQFFADARQVSIIEVAERLGAKLKRAGKHEFTSPCPLGCAKENGFIIDANKSVFYCRPSGSGGDAVDMVAHCRECGKAEAAAWLLEKERPSGRAQVDEAAQREAEAKRAKQAAIAQRRAIARARLEEVKLIRDGEAIASILERAIPFPGTHGADYLAARGAEMPRSMTRDLRFIEELHYWGYADEKTDDITLLATLPAMVALIRDRTGEVAGLHLTYLDPRSPKKWTAPCDVGQPKELRRNNAKKFRTMVAKINGSMIRLGAIGETLVLGEGIETVGAYRQRGFAPEEASFGVAMSLQNLSGGAVAQIDHPTRRQPNGRPTSIPNGIPDPAKPGVILPPQVKRVILLGDGDSDPVGTRAALLTAARRYRAQGVEALIDMAPDGEDFASMAQDSGAANS